MHSRSFRAVRLLVAGLAVVSLAAACGGDDGEEAEADETTTTVEATTTSESTTTTAATGTPEDEQAINEVTVAFFDAFGTSDFDTAQTLLENGETNRAKMEHCNNIAVGVSVQMKTVEFTSAEAATTTFDILIGGAPVLEGAGGGAIKADDGTWLVSENSFLSLYDAAKDGCTGPPPPA